MMIKEHRKAEHKKAYIYLMDLPMGKMFELPSESGHWTKIGPPDENKMVPIGRYGTYEVSKKLPYDTTVIIDV